MPPHHVPQHDGRSATQLVAGVLVIVVGVLSTLHNLGALDAQYYFRFWPVALIAIGLAKLWRALDGHGGTVASLVFTTAGTWLLLEETDLVTIGFLDVWPAWLVLLGASLVWQALSRPRAAAPAPLDPSPGSRRPEDEVRSPAGALRDDGNAVVNATAILGSVVRGNNSAHFRGGALTAVMGGCEIDLRQASIDGEAVIDVFAMWGGIEIRVPEHWTVVSHVTPVLGGVDDSTRPAQAAARHRLVLRGFVIMAGVEVKN